MTVVEPVVSSQVEMLVRMSDKIEINPETDCWEWFGGQSLEGYSRVWHGTRMHPAHRIAYEIFVGPIDEGLHIDHLCRVRNCVNPSHLEPVTARENQLRSPLTLASRNAAKTHCPYGHPYSPENTYSEPRRVSRYCRECKRVRDRSYRERRGG